MKTEEFEADPRPIPEKDIEGQLNDSEGGLSTNYSNKRVCLVGSAITGKSMHCIKLFRCYEPPDSEQHLRGESGGAKRRKKWFSIRLPAFSFQLFFQMTAKREAVPSRSVSAGFIDQKIC